MNGIEKIVKKGKQIGQVKELERPWGVTCEGSYIFVIESEKHCVTKCNKDGNKLMSFGEEGGKQGQMMSPLGIAISADKKHILVVDQLRLQKFTLNGEFVGSASNRKLSFDRPFGIAVHPTSGQIYIADANKHIIIVTNDDLSLSHVFGNKGSNNGELNKPRDVAINSNGIVYVVDYNNDRVCKFTSNGEYISSLGEPQSGTFQLDRPSSIGVDAQDNIYVTEMINGRVIVYDSDDKHVHTFGKCGSGLGEYSGPQGICIDEVNDIIISDTYNNRIIVI